MTLVTSTEIPQNSILFSEEIWTRFGVSFKSEGRNEVRNVNEGKSHIGIMEDPGMVVIFKQTSPSCLPARMGILRTFQLSRNGKYGFLLV